MDETAEVLVFEFFRCHTVHSYVKVVLETATWGYGSVKLHENRKILHQQRCWDNIYNCISGFDSYMLSYVVLVKYFLWNTLDHICGLSNNSILRNKANTKISNTEPSLKSNKIALIMLLINYRYQIWPVVFPFCEVHLLPHSIHEKYIKVTKYHLTIDQTNVLVVFSPVAWRQ